MRNVEFGELIRTLRERDVRPTPHGVQVWRQVDLANASDIPLSTIKRIELGEVRSLSKYLDKLADAFDLSPTERREFYAVAGYLYTKHNESEYSSEDQQKIHELLKGLQFPGSARTPLWDFVAFNEYHRVLWGYDKDLEALESSHSTLGMNLLRIIFDPELREQRTPASNKDPRGLERAIRQFRALSFPYIGTDRYNDIFNAMYEYRAFRGAWEYSSGKPDDEMKEKLKETVEIIDNPHYGEMSFFSLRVPSRYLDSNIYISIYVPTNPDDKIYKKFQKDVTTLGNQLHPFTYRPYNNHRRDG